MFAHHVEAEILQRPDVERHRLFARRREESVRPPALVKRAHQEGRLVVEEEPEDALRVAARRDLAHPEIAFHRVRAARRREVVEIRRVRRPQADGRRQRERHLAVDGRPARARDLDRHLRLRELRTADVERERHRPPVDVGRRRVARDVGLGHGFQPHRLPDPRHARVEAPLRLEALLAARVDEVLRRVPRTDRQLVLTVRDVVRNVERERQVPALVRHVRHLAVADEDLRAEIDRAEVQEDALAGPLPAVDLARVPEELVRPEEPPDAGERGLDRERHADPAVPGRRTSRRVRHGRDGVVPRAVQVRPAVAHELRARVLPPGVRVRHLLAPRRRQRPRRRDTRRTDCSAHDSHFHRMFPFVQFKPLQLPQSTRKPSGLLRFAQSRKGTRPDLEALRAVVGSVDVSHGETEARRESG